MGQLCKLITAVTTCWVFFKYKYNVKTSISPSYQIINFNVSTWYLKPLNIQWDPKS